MNLDRRQFLAGGAAVSLATQLGCGQGTEASPTLGDLSTAREDFPCSQDRVYMNHASQHPEKITGRESRLQAFSAGSRIMRPHRNGLRKSAGLPAFAALTADR